MNTDGGISETSSQKMTLADVKKQLLPVSKDDSALPERDYDRNLRDSDDSSDEEVLLRTGNVPRKWYELYDH